MVENIPIFYTFRKVLKSSAIAKTIQLFQLSKWNDRQSLVNFCQEVEVNLVEEDLAIPMKFSKETLNLVFQVVLPRMAYFLKTAKRTDTRYMLSPYVDFITLLLEMEKEKNSFDDLELHTAILFNTSRALIDSEKAAIRSIQCLKTPSFYNLTSLEKVIFQKAHDLFQKILSTSKARKAIELCFKNLYPGMNQVEIDNTLVFFKENVNKIYFVDQASFWGMVGFGKIYIDSECFQLPKKDKPIEETILAKLIGLFFHELTHLQQRDVRQNAYLTPRSKEPNNIEGGFLIENYLWGSYNVKYWDVNIANFLLDLSNWEGSGSLYTKEEISKLPQRDIDNPNCSGLCVECKGKAEM
jgi:hypothetical protein